MTEFFEKIDQAGEGLARSVLREVEQLGGDLKQLAMLSVVAPQYLGEVVSRLAQNKDLYMLGLIGLAFGESKSIYLQMMDANILADEQKVDALRAGHVQTLDAQGLAKLGLGLDASLYDAAAVVPMNDGSNHSMEVEQGSTELDFTKAAKLFRSNLGPFALIDQSSGNWVVGNIGGGSGGVLDGKGTSPIVILKIDGKVAPFVTINEFGQSPETMNRPVGFTADLQGVTRADFERLVLSHGRSSSSKVSWEKIKTIFGSNATSDLRITVGYNADGTATMTAIGRGSDGGFNVTLFEHVMEATSLIERGGGAGHTSMVAALQPGELQTDIVFLPLPDKKYGALTPTYDPSAETWLYKDADGNDVLQLNLDGSFSEIVQSEPAETIADVDVTKYGYNLDPLNPEIEAMTNSNGVEVFVKVGGNPDNPADVVVRYNEKIKGVEWKFDRDFQDHLISIARHLPVENGHYVYDEQHDSETFGKIVKQYGGDDGLFSPSRFTIGLKDNKHEPHISVYFQRHDREHFDSNSKAPQAGTVFVELPDSSDILEFDVFDLISPIA